MKLDKNTVIGFSLLLVLFVTFFVYTNKQAEAYRKYDEHIKDSTAKANAAARPKEDSVKTRTIAAQRDSTEKVALAGNLTNAAFGKEETTTLCLIPMIRKVTHLPLIAAGGIASGAAMLAAMTLGAEGVQVGSLFAATEESSAHINFKNEILKASNW